MPAYLVVTIEVHDSTAYDRYRQMVPASIAAYGGRYLARGGTTETLEGTWAPKRLVIVEFPSVQQAKEWLSSPEYREARALRHACAATQMVLIDGV